MERSICVRSARCGLPVGWVLLQAGDVITTYWGLTYPTIVEANPVMAPVIGIPIVVIFLKVVLTVGVLLVAALMERRTHRSSLPVLAALNAWMLFVCINNSVLIARASGVDLAALATRAISG